jgi:cytochrome c
VIFVFLIYLIFGSLFFYFKPLKFIILKKYFFGFALITFMTACGGGTSTENKSDSTSTSSSTETPAGNDVSDNPDYKAGLKMIAASDCLTCHDVATKKIGPAYQEVANKYAGVDTALGYLAGKIITGGQGVWGTVPMTPHATLSLDSAKQMVKYVLLLKTK